MNFDALGKNLKAWLKNEVCSSFLILFIKKFNDFPSKINYFQVPYKHTSEMGGKLNFQQRPLRRDEDWGRGVDKISGCRQGPGCGKGSREKKWENMVIKIKIVKRKSTYLFICLLKHLNVGQLITALQSFHLKKLTQLSSIRV